MGPFTGLAWRPAAANLGRLSALEAHIVLGAENKYLCEAHQVGVGKCVREPVQGQ